MKIIVIKEDTDAKEEDYFKLKRNKCIACGEEFTTQLRCERRKDNETGQVWHLRCLYGWLTAQIEQREKAIALLKKDKEILEKYKDEMMLEELAK